jgi:hypothetical protein
MSTILHSYMCTSVPEIFRNMCTIMPKGSLLSILVLLFEFLER